MQRNIVSLLVIVVILLFVFMNLHRTDVTYITSDMDRTSYLVRNTHDKQAASNMLGSINNNINKFVDCLNKNKETSECKEYKQYIDQLTTRIKNCKFSESTPDSTYTSYSVNKGDEIIFCLRSKETGKLHDINLVMFVCLHELAHVGCPEIGHGELFKKIFVFFLKQAQSCGVYAYTDFKTNPTEYCGMQLTETP